MTIHYERSELKMVLDEKHEPCCIETPEGSECKKCPPSNEI